MLPHLRGSLFILPQRGSSTTLSEGVSFGTRHHQRCDLSLAPLPAILAPMSKTLAQRRRDDRERKRAERARKRESGVPSIAQVQNAITEAVAYAIASIDQDAILPGWTPINAAVIVAVAIDILAERGSFDPIETRLAVRDALAPRDAHRLAGHIPSLSPGGTGPHYKTKAPDAVTRRRP